MGMFSKIPSCGNNFDNSANCQLSANIFSLELRYVETNFALLHRELEGIFYLRIG